MIHALIAAVTLLVGTTLVVLGATRVARSGGVSRTLDLLVAVPIITATQIVVTVLLAGAVMRQLNLAAVLVTNAVVTGAALLFLRPERTRERPSARRTAASLVSASRRQPFVAALALLALVALAWRAVIGLVLPPYGFDALTYHLPAVVEWLQRGRIATGTLNLCCAYYPQNGELLVTWPALLGKGFAYVSLVQIAFALLGGAAVAGIARCARVPPAGALAAAAIFVLTPILLVQSNTAYVDVTFAAEAVAACYLVIRALESTGRLRLFLLACAGAATGLCVGTKLTGIEFVAALALPLVVAAALQPRSRWRELAVEAACSRSRWPRSGSGGTSTPGSRPATRSSPWT